jgi:hypothetical protein
MDIRLKVAFTMVAVVTSGLGVSFGVGSILAKSAPQDPFVNPDPNAAAVADIPFNDTTSFPSTTFTLDEGYSIEVPEGWQLVAQTPTRRVDRYRFERVNDKNSIFTISIYDRTTLDGFDDLIQARYGASYLREQADVTVNGLAAKRVSAEFLDMGATLDVLVAADPETYVSLYGIHAPAAASDLEISKQINFMQRSFTAS